LLQELKGGVIKAGSIIRGKCVEILQTYPPDAGDFHVLAKLLGHIAQSGGGSVMGSELAMRVLRFT